MIDYFGESYISIYRLRNILENREEELYRKNSSGLLFEDEKREIKAKLDEISKIKQAIKNNIKTDPMIISFQEKERKVDVDGLFY